MRTFPCALFVALSVSLFVLAGCNSDPRAKVTGTVTFNDKPLPGGTVVFASDDGVRYDRVKVGKDGSYSSTNVPVGNCKIAVEPAAKSPQSQMPKGQKLPENAPPANQESDGDYVNIPPELRSPATSQIVFKVEPGDQSFNIPLKGDGKGGSSGKGYTGSKGP